MAKMADVVVVSVGFGPSTEGEGLDRTYQLPFGQEELIRAIAAANPHTIVVLTAGGSVATQGLDRPKCPSVTDLVCRSGGRKRATKILFGDVNPSGKLPISWEKKIEDNPTYNNYYEAPDREM